MKFKDLLSQLPTMLQGGNVTVEFSKDIKDLESYPEPGMRGDIVSAVEDHDGVIILRVDYTKYDAFNTTFESHNYYDKNGEACLTAREAGWYKQVDTLYLMEDDDVSRFMVMLGDTNDLFKQYQDEHLEDVSYVRWLEGRIGDMQGLIDNLEQDVESYQRRYYDIT